MVKREKREKGEDAKGPITKAGRKQRAEGEDAKDPIKKATRTVKSEQAAQLLSGPASSDAYEAARVEHARDEEPWFTRPDEEYIDMKRRHPEKQGWSPQCTAVLKTLTAVYREQNENGLPSTPWAAGWRWELPFDHRDHHHWYPPKAIAAVANTDLLAGVLPKHKDWESDTLGLKSPEALTLLERLMGLK